MNPDAKGQTVVRLQQQVEPVKLAELAAAIGTASGAETARLVPFFGPTIAGDQRLVEVLGLDLSKAMLAGQAYEWTRPFTPDEMVDIHVFIEDIYDKGENRFGVVSTEINDAHGQVVQRQRTTFIERSAK